MLKRVFALFLFSLFILLSIGQLLVEASEIFDITNIQQGIIRINLTSENKKTKVMIQKNNTTYYYNINADKDVFPLQMGSGAYQLAFLEQVEGNKYEIKNSESIQVKLKDDEIPFLQSASPVYWHKDSEAVKMAVKLSESMDTDEKKAYAIYDYITKNIKYDKNKIAGLEPDYIPSVDEILSSSKGICYDYAALYAAMLRSINIPAKLVKGYKNDIDTYHAWNEVYLQQQGWVTIDATYDAVMLENGTSSEFLKDTGDYKKEKEY